jgi:hypothetical protein
MRNRALLRRLARIEAKSNQSARAIGLEFPFAEEEHIPLDEVERAYRRLKASVPRSESFPEQTEAQVLAEYLRMVRGSSR